MNEEVFEEVLENVESNNEVVEEVSEVSTVSDSPSIEISESEVSTETEIQDTEVVEPTYKSTTEVIFKVVNGNEENIISNSENDNSESTSKEIQQETESETESSGDPLNVVIEGSPDLSVPTDIVEVQHDNYTIELDMSGINSTLSDISTRVEQIETSQALQYTYQGSNVWGTVYQFVVLALLVMLYLRVKHD